MKITASKRVLAIPLFVLVLFGILVIGFFAYSFYLMRTTNGTHLAMFVNTEKEILAQNVNANFPERDGEKLMYTFPVKLKNAIKTGSSYKLTLTPTFPAGESFEYELPRDTYSGTTELESLEKGSSVKIVLTYELPQDLRYLGEYSFCTAKKAYDNYYGIGSSCARGNCVVDRGIANWDVEIPASEVAEKEAYLSSYDTDKLLKALTYYFMTNDFGYFKPSSMKYQSVQLANTDGTYTFGSKYITSSSEGINKTPLLFWFLSGASSLINSEDIDVNAYINAIVGYIPSDGYGDAYFQNCRASSFIVSNLKECNTPECGYVKDQAFDYCKATLSSVISKYESTKNLFTTYSENSILRGHLFNMASQMLEFNQMVDALGKNETKYDEATLLDYYGRGKALATSDEAILPKCYSLESAKDIYSQYPSDGLLADINARYSEIEGIETLCEREPENGYCKLTISEKLVCVDALIGYKSDIAKSLIADIFYAHYFKSPGSSEMVTYENWRTSPYSEENAENLKKLDEYGYLTWVEDNNGYITHSANVGDSYYFINLLKLLSNE